MKLKEILEIEGPGTLVTRIGSDSPIGFIWFETPLTTMILEDFIDHKALFLCSEEDDYEVYKEPITLTKVNLKETLVLEVGNIARGLDRGTYDVYWVKVENPKST